MWLYAEIDGQPWVDKLQLKGVLWPVISGKKLWLA